MKVKRIVIAQLSKFAGRFVIKKRGGFICQINPESLQVVSWQIIKNKPEVLKTEIEPITQDLNDEQISERLNRLFKRLGLNKEPIIISLPRILATCRYLKLPSAESAEIERMVRFQAGRFLPYSANELIAGFSLIRRDSQGYSFVNLIIVHRDVVERLLKILKKWKTQIEAILLSSYTLAYWYRKIKPKQEQEPVMILNVQQSNGEIAVVCQGNLLFSRAFKLPESKSEIYKCIAEEVDKTLKSYQKETHEEQPVNLILTGLTEELLKDIKDLKLNLPIEYIAGNPLTAVAGERIESCLNLLPPSEKEKRKKLSLRKEYLRITYLIFGVIFFLSLGLLITLHNKKVHLNRLKQELAKISPQVKTIEDMEKRTRIISTQIWQMPKAIDVLYEIYRFLPKEISLTALIYEENSQVTLRGQTRDLSAVFNAVSNLEKSELFSNVKVRYATRKKVQTQEVVDFEIVCQMKPRLMER
jgi:Tfp pilus assembly PilM family ATPase/Tfp pilus assembly protein PilN